MKFKTTAALLFLLMPATLWAQSSEQQKADSVFMLVKKYFNENNNDALYALTGDAFKKALPPETFKNITSQQLFPIGQMQKTTFISFENHIATYKIEFPVATLKMLLSLDKNRQLEVFLLRPYTEPASAKTGTVKTSNPLKTKMDIQIDSIARTYIQKANTVGLSIGIFKNGQTYTYGYGETAKGNGNLPDQNTIFEIGSITKTFTSILLASAVNEGKVKLTDPITLYLPDSVAANKNLQKVTIVMLANHTSSLARLPDNLSQPGFIAANPYNGYNRAMLFSYLKNCNLATEPGTTYAYSNLAVGLLGTILEKVYGLTFEQMVTDKICRPLAMHSTMQRVPPGNSLFAPVYNSDGVQTPAWNFDALAACGSLHSTVTDLLIYGRTNMANSNTALSKAMLLTQQVTFDKNVKIGLAWHIIPIAGVGFYFHNGGTYGSSSFLAFNAEHHIAVVVLSNAAESTDTIGTAIGKLLLESTD